jgi:hypothetical protein
MDPRGLIRSDREKTRLISEVDFARLTVKFEENSCPLELGKPAAAVRAKPGKVGVPPRKIHSGSEAHNPVARPIYFPYDCSLSICVRRPHG